MKYISGNIIKADLVNLGIRIGLITQPFKDKYVCAFPFRILNDLKGNKVDEHKIIYKEVKEEEIKEIKLEDLTTEEIKLVNFLKNELLVGIRKRKLDKLGL